MDRQILFNFSMLGFQVQFLTFIFIIKLGIFLKKKFKKKHRLMLTNKFFKSRRKF